MQAAPKSHNDKSKARALALAMHALFIVLLIFGVSWQKKPPAPVEAELWSSLPQMPQPKVEAAPAPEPEPPKPVPRVTPPAPKAEPAPLPKPDIALKKKPEKKAEPKPEPKAEPQKREEDRAVRARREAEEKQRREEMEDEQKRLTADREAKAAAEKAAAAERAARAAAAREMQKYVDGIRAKVFARIALPGDLQGNPEAEFIVALLPGGDLQSVTMSRSSGNAAYDKAVESAIRQAQPFVVPSGDEFQRNFRRFPMIFRPR